MNQSIKPNFIAAKVIKITCKVH